jgi:hypothetical protein
VPREGRERRDEIWRRRFILASDLRDDPTFILNSYNCITSGAWEFYRGRRVCYLGDVGYFNRDLGVSLDEEEEQEDKDDDTDDEEALFDNGGAPPPPVVDSEIQATDLRKEEALELEIGKSELEELGRWNGLAIKLRESALAQERPVTPPVTPTCVALPAPPASSTPQSALY